MTKEVRTNKEKFCLFCVQNRTLPYCSRKEMLPGCPWAEVEDRPENCYFENEAVIFCACCGKEKYIPDKELWTYKKVHKKGGNAYHTDFYCSYTCWRKEDKYLEDMRGKKKRTYKGTIGAQGFNASPLRSRSILA